MKRLLLIALVCLCGCERMYNTNILGSWSEHYDDPDFMMDSNVTHTFNEDGSYIVRTYDLLMNQEDFITYEYSIQGDVITVSTSIDGNTVTTSYDITKLNKNEMSWKRVGSTGNSYGYDIRHFVRDE